MFVTALPMLVELPVGQAAQIAVTITSTTSIIDAYTVRAFGLDPQWLTVDPGRLSLFPAEVGLVEITVTLPADFPAGLRNIAVHVQSENDPNEFTLAQIALDVGTRSRTTLRVDPVTITAGNSAQFALAHNVEPTPKIAEGTQDREVGVGFDRITDQVVQRGQRLVQS